MNKSALSIRTFESLPLTPVWHAAGWLHGATSALFGRQAAFRTVAAVETFVEGHNLAQIRIMESTQSLESLAAVLREFCADEVHHRAGANTRLTNTDGAIARVWAYLIATGSALGVRVARKI